MSIIKTPLKLKISLNVDLYQKHPLFNEQPYTPLDVSNTSLKYLDATLSTKSDCSKVTKTYDNDYAFKPINISQLQLNVDSPKHPPPNKMLHSKVTTFINMRRSLQRSSCSRNRIRNLSS